MKRYTFFLDKNLNRPCVITGHYDNDPFKVPVKYIDRQAGEDNARVVDLKPMVVSFHQVKELYRNCKILGVSEALGRDSKGEFDDVFILNLVMDETVKINPIIEDSFLTTVDDCEVNIGSLVERLFQLGYDQYNLVVQSFFKGSFSKKVSSRNEYPHFGIWELLQIDTNVTGGFGINKINLLPSPKTGTRLPLTNS